MATGLKIDSGGLYAAVGRILEGYSAEISQRLDETADEVSKSALQAIKADSPVHRGTITRGGKRRQPGTYRKSWKRKKVNGRYLIYSSQPGLTFLLEEGHALKNGGRARAFPHIKKNADAAAKEFEQRVKQILGGIG